MQTLHSKFAKQQNGRHTTPHRHLGKNVQAKEQSHNVWFITLRRTTPKNHQSLRLTWGLYRWQKKIGIRNSSILSMTHKRFDTGRIKWEMRISHIRTAKQTYFIHFAADVWKSSSARRKEVRAKELTRLSLYDEPLATINLSGQGNEATLKQ